MTCLPTGFCAAEVDPRERLVHDADAWHGPLLWIEYWSRVVDAEVTSADHPNAHRVEVRRRDAEKVRRHFFGLARGHIDRPSPPVLAQRRPGGECRRLDTWHPTNLVGQGRPHVWRLPLTRPVDVQQQDALRLESQWPVRQVPQRRRKQTGDEEHEETERHLAADQRAHETTVDVRVVVALDGDERLDGRRSQGRSDTKQHGDGQRQRQAERHRAPVEIEHQSNRLPDLGQQRDDERRRPPGEDGADDRCTDREQCAFDEHQLDETPAPGANRHAQRHLASASDGLSREQIGDIRAGDQQHEHDESGEDEQRKTECTVEGRMRRFLRGRRGSSRSSRR